MTLGGNGMEISDEEFANIIFYGEAESWLLVVPIEVNAFFFAGPIFGDGVMFLEKTAEVMGVVFANIFNDKVIYDDKEIDKAPFVAP